MKFIMSLAICQRLRKVVASAGRLEIGGVLMAEQLAPGHFRLDDFTVDSRTGSKAHFVRSVEDHQMALTNYFQKTGSDFARFNYLGEWHSHPNHPPIPSGTDIRSMTSLVNGERAIPFSMLLIVKAFPRALECSATLFQRNHSPERADVDVTH